MVLTYLVCIYKPNQKRNSLPSLARLWWNSLYFSLNHAFKHFDWKSSCKGLILILPYLFQSISEMFVQSFTYFWCKTVTKSQDGENIFPSNQVMNWTSKWNSRLSNDFLTDIRKLSKENHLQSKWWPFWRKISQKQWFCIII